MNQQKGFRYYLMIFGLATVAILLYTGFDAISNGGFDNSLLWSLALAPIIFTFFLFVFDRLFDFIIPSKAKQKNKGKDAYSDFLAIINMEVETQTEFSIEDFRRLRDSEKFQKAMKQSYRILTDGETEDITYEYLLKKFKKESREQVAMNVVINEVKKLKENS